MTLAASKRFFAPEISKVYFATTLATYQTALLRAEITAAIPLTDEIANISGFEVQSGLIDTPDLGHRFTSKIAGRTSTADSSLTVYADQGGDDVRKVLPRGTKGFVIFADSGDEEDLPADIFPVEVTSVGKVRSTGDQAFQLTIGFAITAVPAEDIALPATA